MILVSACLLGVNCKYNGKNNKNQKIIDYLKDKRFIMVCPEQLGGLTTPRVACEIISGCGQDVLENKSKVLNKNGEDVTENFIKGAYETLKIAQDFNCKEAILKEKSPSCGVRQIYDGTFSGNLKDGCGVTAFILKSKGINLKNENDF
ncbi:Uncharacterized conserved protein YbbK, DUF523 family [Alkalithermobacter thermoalcaliphilus JW-YL-7 = DSM 7308]|uniref:Uncharacterized conserved protein YbbK, DUF523 family n=1 Tax=Alkalithermobacter thermoalcaliphilus JW-YL-7 = DSM 7308 TaxID=1121328 RepID=A0A150FP36_CLOPD|nr:protein of unknown function DUF523 [[Clostridium] paradoxum JW-YL-7 = DSM 7308]SHK55169.1 Uncharacterized conserved protein YbbK, DUF523 family [[Clostridium] paradoxum JW-YL-7 = DSM 7308]